MPQPSPKEEHKNYWYINNLFDIIKNILFCIAFTMKKSNKLKNPIEESYEDSYEDDPIELDPMRNPNPKSTLRPWRR